MGELIGLLIIAGLVISWILAGRNFYRAGFLLRFIGHIVCCVVLVVVYWGIIVYPTMHCMGFLCGLSEGLLFIGLSAATILIWGLLILVYSGNKFPKSNEKLFTGKHRTAEHPPIEDEEF